MPLLANLTHKQKVVGLNLISFNILDGNGIKAMPGLINAPNSVWLWKNEKNTGSQMGHTKKTLKKTMICHYIWLIFYYSLHPGDNIHHLLLSLLQPIWSSISGAKRFKSWCINVSGTWCWIQPWRPICQSHTSCLHSHLHHHWVHCLPWLDQGCWNSTEPLGWWWWRFSS